MILFSKILKSKKTENEKKYSKYVRGVRLPPHRLIDSHKYLFDYRRWLKMYRNTLYELYDLFIKPYKTIYLFDLCTFRTFCSFVFINSSRLKTNYLN